MFLQIFKTVVLIFSIVFSAFTFSAEISNVTQSYFSPRQGPEVFQRMYELIGNATKYVHISIYSWRDKKIKIALQKAKSNGADVRIVLHPPLYKKKARIQKIVVELESVGVQVKIAKQQMHEKIILIDDELLINSSANMSSGPKSKYSENWIFHKRTPQTQNIFDDFTHEFTILWNTSSDVITHGESIANELNGYKTGTRTMLLNLPDQQSSAPLYSSSMNFKLERNPVHSKEYKKGKFLKMIKRKDINKKHTWLIRDKVISTIDKASSNISCSFNHLFISEIADALVEASRRGVNVRLAVDNQELSSHAKTFNFVAGWKKIKGNKKKEAPVRVKFYSIAPSPAYWFLNHHKFCVVDYGTDSVSLINGSYNFSRTAEQKQFDNQVFYSGTLFNNLFKSFQEEFEYLYTLNRTVNDKPNKKIVNYFLKPNSYGAYPLHNFKPISLTWKEAKDLKRKLSKLAPGITRTGQKKRNCRFYKFIKKDDLGKIISKYYGCPKPR